MQETYISHLPLCRRTLPHANSTTFLGYLSNIEALLSRPSLTSQVRNGQILVRTIRCSFLRSLRSPPTIEHKPAILSFPVDKYGRGERGRRQYSITEVTALQRGYSAPCYGRRDIETDLLDTMYTSRRSILSSSAASNRSPPTLPDRPSHSQHTDSPTAPQQSTRSRQSRSAWLDPLCYSQQNKSPDNSAIRTPFLSHPLPLPLTPPSSPHPHPPSPPHPHPHPPQPPQPSAP